jgi:hypothetical protein
VGLPDRADRAGFAAPLAIVMLIAVALLALLMLEGALGEVRSSSAVASEARVVGKAESALAGMLGRTFDSTAASFPAGAVLAQESTGGVDSVHAVVQLAGGGVARVVVRVRSTGGAIRVLAGRQAFAALRPHPSLPGELILAPLAGNWWVTTP